MDTQVPAIESGEDMTTPLEGSLAHPETPENSDVALFKRQIAQSNPAFTASIPASKLSTEAEQREGLIDLSHQFKDLLGNEMAHHSADTKKAPLSPQESSLQTEIALNKAGTQIGEKDVHIDPLVQKDVIEKTVVDRPDVIKSKSSSNTGMESFKKESASIQDNPYVAPLGTPLVSQSTPIQSTNSLEAHAAMISQQIKDQVIDRILVSTNELATDKTVKVVLNPNVLQGTEVNFQKAGDMLSVQFVSRNESSLQFLQVNQADLQGYLQNELKQFKGVAVSVKPSGNSAEQPEDGRSRNRYEYQTPDEDEQ